VDVWSIGWSWLGMGSPNDYQIFRLMLSNAVWGGIRLSYMAGQDRDCQHGPVCASFNCSAFSLCWFDFFPACSRRASAEWTGQALGSVTHQFKPCSVCSTSIASVSSA
jgi:hypothetical protein